LITYVNRRPVDSRLLSYALIESYHRFLPRGRYPVAFLFVDVPPGIVDVNVHPTKREVRFRNEPGIRSMVMNKVTALLESEARKALPKGTPVQPVAPVVPDPPARTVDVAPAAPATQVHSKPAIGQPAWRPEAVPQPPAPRTGKPRIWEFLGIFRKRIGLFESPDGLVLLNGRAARERILMEKIEASLQGSGSSRQDLLMPYLMELTPLDASVLGDQLPFFDSLGFTIEPFGRHLFRIRCVPAWLQGEDAESFVEDLVNRIRERGVRTENFDTTKTLIARLAATREARAYVPSGESAWRRLASDLLACENPLLDARGRPTFIEMRDAELSRKLMLDGPGGRLDDLDGVR
jgi:DNA mismatch repair protein MutL